jgi:hypothetical protein
MNRCRPGPDDLFSVFFFVGKSREESSSRLLGAHDVRELSYIADARLAGKPLLVGGVGASRLWAAGRAAPQRAWS